MIRGDDGNFYGTTIEGGVNGFGAVFKITPDGAFMTLHSFDGADGEYPTAALLRGHDGNFYGTTRLGSANGNGTVFKMTPESAVTTLVSFDEFTKGGEPQVPLLESHGSFYGTTSYGTLFQITPSGELVVLHIFGSSADVNGSAPITGLIRGNDGNLYGTTCGGGPTNDGTIYQVTPSGKFTTLYRFDNLNGEGSVPNKLTLGSDGSFYGTTDISGEGGTGTFFQLAGVGKDPAIQSFSPPNGRPGSRVTVIGNNFKKITGIRFGGADVDRILSRSDTQITVVVPYDAQSGFITVKRPDGVAASATPFHVDPILR